MNKKSLMIATLSLGMAFTAGSSSASTMTMLSNGIGVEGVGDCSWHFVNNQTGGVAGSLSVTVYDGSSNMTVFPIAPYKVLNRVNHYSVDTSPYAKLVSGYVTSPGRLVLSDYECEVKKEPPPDPK